MSMKNYYSNQYASIERNPDGTWAVFNDVTGLLEAENLSYPAAHARMIELAQYYRSVERGNFQIQR